MYSNGQSYYTSGGGNHNQSTPPATTVVVGVSAQVFRCVATGLRPNTLHKAYLVNTDVSANCAPIPANGSTTTTYSYGAPLVTDSKGRLTFDYAFTPTNSPYQTQFISQANATIAIIPAGNQAFKVQSTDGNSHASSFIQSKGS
jgi:hypothetical protein